MPKPRPPFLVREVTRHGKTVWYVRKGAGKRIRLTAEYGTPEFAAQYQAAISGQSPEPERKPSANTVAWAIRQYMRSMDWSALSAATRANRSAIFAKIRDAAGNAPISDVTTASIRKALDKRRETPSAAAAYLKAIRGLFKWMIDAGLIDADPSAGLRVKQPNTEGHHTWTEDECRKFEARWPLGTRERLAFDILLYTGLRRGDAVMFGPFHVKDGKGRVRTEKSRRAVMAVFPILPALAASIKAGPCGETTFICRHDNRGPMSKKSFGGFFREACEAAGVPGSAHGLRKAGACRAAEKGLTERELDAMFGWKAGSRESARYTAKASAERLSDGASIKLLRDGS